MSEDEAAKEAGKIEEIVSKLKKLKKLEAERNTEETPAETSPPPRRIVQRAPPPDTYSYDVNLNGKKRSYSRTGQPIETQPYIQPRQKQINFKSLHFADLLLLILILVVHILDWIQAFQRTPAQIGSFFAMYTTIALFCAAIIRYEGEDFWNAFIHRYFLYALVAILWPRLLGFLFNLFPTVGDTMVQGITFLEFLFIIATYFPIFIILVYSKSRSYFSKFVKFYYVGSIFIIAIFITAGSLQEIPGGTEAVFVGNEGAQIYWDFVKESSQQFWSDLLGFPASIESGINSTINRYTEVYFVGEVEQNKRVKLGVFLDNLDPLTDPILPEDQKIIVYADINAQTFKGNITIHNSCYAEFRPNDGTKNPPYIQVQGTIDYPDISIHDYEYQQIKCTIDRSQINTLDKSIRINFTSQFNFITWAYMDLMFMDRKLLFQNRKAGADALKATGLRETVRSIYTAGPVELGLARGDSPLLIPIGLDRENPIPPVYGATLRNSADYLRRGHIVKINKLVYHVPKYMYFNQDACDPITFTSTQTTPDGLFDTYTFQNIPLRAGTDEQTVRCRLGIDPENVDAFLGDAHTAFTTFSVEADYDYELSEYITIKLAPDLLT